MGLDAAKARLDEIAPKVRRIGKKNETVSAGRRPGRPSAGQEGWPSLAGGEGPVPEMRDTVRAVGAGQLRHVRPAPPRGTCASPSTGRNPKSAEISAFQHRCGPEVPLAAEVGREGRHAGGRGATADPPDDDRDEGVPAGFEPEPATIADGHDAPGTADRRRKTARRTSETADEPQEVVEEELQPVTDEQIAAADSFVAAVGGLEQAARALVARSIKGGGNDGLKSVMAATVRAASELLTPSEIAEIAIVDSARAKGILWVSA